MKQRVILDTGPLIAFLNRSDRHHDWAVATWSEIAPPMLSCEAVVAESCHLVRSIPGASAAVVELVRRGVVVLPFSLMEQCASVGRLIVRYQNRPMSLADACLVRMAESLGGTVLTVDSDFRVYRMHGRRVVPTLMPEGV